MINVEWMIAFTILLLLGIGAALFGKKGLKFQVAFLTVATLYMLVHTILHPESNSKFFALIGFVFIVQNFKKFKAQN